MSASTDNLPPARYADGFVTVRLEGGGQISFLVAENPRLAKGTPEQLGRIEVSPFGLHWPDLDEDLSFAGLARGDFGQPGSRRK